MFGTMIVLLLVVLILKVFDIVQLKVENNHIEKMNRIFDENMDERKA